MPTLRLRSKKTNATSSTAPLEDQNKTSTTTGNRVLTRRKTRETHEDPVPAVTVTPQQSRPGENGSVHLNVSPETAKTISSKTAVVRLQRYGTRSSTARRDGQDPGAPPPPAEQQPKRNGRQTVRRGEGGVQGSSDNIVEPPSADPPQQQQQSKRQPARRKKRPRREPVEVEEEEANDEEIPENNILLPDVSLFPLHTDPHLTQMQKIRELRTSISNICGSILNQIQDDEDCLIPCFESVEKIYEYFDRSGLCRQWGEEGTNFGLKYRNVCVSALYGFGAVIWKHNIGQGPNHNPYAEKASKFLEYCLLHLGWNADKRKDDYLKEWKDSRYQPASYLALRFFYKNHSDTNAFSRQSQLSLINKFMETANETGNYDYIQVVWEAVGNCVLIRVKDKSAACRVLALKILSYFVVLEEATAICQKELKYYTRYDPFVEVRRLGTKILAEKTRIKLRFFFDQAFDKRESVRVEAFKAMGVVCEKDREEVEEGDEEQMPMELVRDMGSLAGDKLCKVIVWGAVHSGVKCNNIVKSEILPKWLKMSCNSDLVQFLAKIDAYEHMKAVVKILDMLLTTKEQEDFVESLDLSFIPLLKANVMARNYKPITIEAFVAWLGLCKASEVVESIRGKVIPTADEMMEIIVGLHDCVFREHEEAKDLEKNEDVTPVFCLVLALEISKRFVAWEEANRRELVSLLKRLLLDPILDDRIIVIQAINTLHSFIDEAQFEEVMMTVFQECFDSKTGFRRSDESRETHRVGEENEEMGISVSRVNVQVADNGNDLNEETPQNSPDPVPKTAYELTKMRSNLCELAMARLKLQKDKQELIQKKMFIDAIPINNKILEIQTKEAELSAELREQEDLAKSLNEARKEAQSMGLRQNIGNADLARRSMVISSGDGAEDNTRDEEDEGVDGGDRDERDVANTSGIINTVEEGLAKGMFMLNSFLDLCPKMGAFVRNIYEAHVAGFMSENDVNLKVSVLQFLTRIGIIDKREVRKVFCFMIRMMLSNVEVELRNAAFQSIVDLIICYEYGDFCMRDEEKREDDFLHPYKNDMTHYLEEMLPNENVDYMNCTPEIMEKLTIELLGKRFPPATTTLNSQEINILNATKNTGLLKLLVRGRLRDPRIISKILCLWVNHDYSGTVVLRDLEHVLKLYGTFEWWGDGSDGVVEEIDGEVTNEDFKKNGMMRILGISVGEGVVGLCHDPVITGKEGEEVLMKFVTYFLGFLEVDDQPLMRTMVYTILNPILASPGRSCNNLLVRCASKVPITSPISASSVVLLINNLFHKIREHPMTPSVTILKKELCAFLAKLKRVFGDDIAVVKDADGKNKIVGQDFDDDDDDDLGEVEGVVSEGNSSGRHPSFNEEDASNES